MPLAALNDTELGTLVQAAFLEAKSVKVTFQLPTQRHKTVVLSNKVVLEALAGCFRIGSDRNWPDYPYPGLTYARVEFDGPYRPDFSVYAPTVFFPPGRRVHVQSAFARRLADQLGIKPVAKAGN